MDGWDLTAKQRKRLERTLHRTRDARVYRRALAILEVSRGLPIEDVAQRLGVSRQSVYNWMAQYVSAESPASLADQPRSGRPRLWTEQRQAWLKYVMRLRPDVRGYFANAWTVPLLQEELRHCRGPMVSEDTIRRGLTQLGYVWKRSRYVLLPDPDKEKKTPNSPENQPFAAPERVAGRG
jgi:transposase